MYLYACIEIKRLLHVGMPLVFDTACDVAVQLQNIMLRCGCNTPGAQHTHVLVSMHVYSIAVARSAAGMERSVVNQPPAVLVVLRTSHLWHRWILSALACTARPITCSSYEYKPVCIFSSCVHLTVPCVSLQFVPVGRQCSQLLYARIHLCERHDRCSCAATKAEHYQASQEIQCRRLLEGPKNLDRPLRKTGCRE